MVDLYFAPLFGLIVGLVIGMTGVGGGALLAPILLFFYGLEIKVVIATDLLFAAFTKLIASTTHIKNSYIDWQVLYKLWMGSIPSSIIILVFVFYGFSIDSDLIISAVGLLIIFSGVLAATSSISTPPSVDAITTSWPLALSRVIAK